MGLCLCDIENGSGFESRGVRARPIVLSGSERNYRVVDLGPAEAENESRWVPAFVLMDASECGGSERVLGGPYDIQW